MNINPKIFKAYDIRGIYPTDTNEEVVSDITKAIYTFISQDLKKESLTVVLSRDMRVSSPALFESAKKAFLEMGATVIDIGLASTPTFYFAVRYYQADGGIQISASHNPKEWSGMKFVKREGEKIIKIGKVTGMDKVKEIASNKKFLKNTAEGKVVKKTDTLEKELDEVFDFVKPTHLKKLKVVADPANSMGILYLEALAKRLPIELVKMNFTLDGTFPAHQPDPLQFKLLKSLQDKVKEEKADLGIAPDGDGDRVFFVDEKGEIIPATHISSLIAHEMLEKNPGETIVVDIRYTNNVAKVTQKYGGKTSISKVGHALITEQLNREGALFAGESSGHYYFRATGGAESSLRVILMVLEIISRENKPISQILSQYVSSYESGEVNFVLPSDLNSKVVVDKIANSYKDGQANYLDGLAVDYPTWRFSVRTSNTEPLLRLNVEGDRKEEVIEQVENIKKMIVSLGGKVHE